MLQSKLFDNITQFKNSHINVNEVDEMNYNPYYQSVYGNPYIRNNVPPVNPYMNNMNIPFSTPRMRQPNALGSSLFKGGQSLNKTFTFSRFLNGTQNVIETVNSAIPIYQQVKPLFSNSKVLTSAIKKVFNNKASSLKTKPSTTSTSSENIKLKEEEKTEKPSYKEQNQPNRPFF